MRKHKQAEYVEIEGMPYDEGAEQSVLGACLLEPAIVAEMSEIVQPEDFYRADNQYLYRQMLWLYETTNDCSLVDLNGYLRDEGKPLLGGGHLLQLRDDCEGAAPSLRHAKTVLEKSKLRQLILAAEDVIGQAKTPRINADEVIEKHAAKIFDLGKNCAGEGYEHISVSVEDARLRYDARLENPGAISGLSTGFPSIDRITGGLQNGQFTIIAGATSMGKTSLAMQMAWDVAFNQRLPVAFVSLEMTRALLVDRYVSQIGRVDGWRFSVGRNDEAEQFAARSAMTQMKHVNLYIDQEPAQTVFKMMNRANRLAMKHAPRLIVVDYLQLAHSNDPTGKSRANEVDAVAQGLAEMAKRFNCPVLALAQLNRNNDGRMDKRPVLSDLRESAGLEQAAGVVQFAYRPGYYSKDPNDTSVELIVAKNRTGPTGTVTMEFTGKHARFDEVEKEGFEHYANR